MGGDGENFFIAKGVEVQKVWKPLFYHSLNIEKSIS